MRRVARRPHDGATRNGVATLSSGGAGREETWRGVRCDAKGLRTVTERESSSASVSVASVSPRSTFQLPRVSLSTAPRNSETRLSERERESARALFATLSLLFHPSYPVLPSPPLSPSPRFSFCHSYLFAYSSVTFLVGTLRDSLVIRKSLSLVHLATPSFRRLSWSPMKTPIRES